MMETVIGKLLSYIYSWGRYQQGKNRRGREFEDRLVGMDERRNLIRQEVRKGEWEDKGKGKG